MDLLNDLLDKLKLGQIAFWLAAAAVVLFVIMLFLAASMPKLRKNLSIGMFVLAVVFLLILSPMKTTLQEITNFLPGGAATGGE